MGEDAPREMVSHADLRKVVRSSTFLAMRWTVRGAARTLDLSCCAAEVSDGSDGVGYDNINATHMLVVHRSMLSTDTCECFM